MSVEALVQLAGPAAVEHGEFGARTTYRVGGTARVVLSVETTEQLASLSGAIRASALAVVVLGNGSNLLVSDNEFNGVVIILGEGFASLRWHDEGDFVVVDVGAAMNLPVVARQLSDAGVLGFEWAVGVPGTMGGAAVMNAGGHGSQMANCVVSLSAWSLNADQSRLWLTGDLAYGYRTSSLTASDVVTSVTMRLRRGPRDEARNALREIVRWRREHQPGGANAGSVFRNAPEGAAGSLIEAAGMKGHRIGSAYVSTKHANFIQVDTNGRAADVLALMIEVRDAVQRHSGVRLVSELRTVGFETEWS